MELVFAFNESAVRPAGFSFFITASAISISRFVKLTTFMALASKSKLGRADTSARVTGLSTDAGVTFGSAGFASHGDALQLGQAAGAFRILYDIPHAVFNQARRIGVAEPVQMHAF